jgi:hypothetical protein
MYNSNEDQARALETHRTPEQLELLATQETPKGFVPFTRTEFTREYEALVRTITNPNGQHNSAYSDKERNMLPQDTLDKAWGWFHGNTGFSCMFLWASGRQDAWLVLDTPEPSKEALEVQQNLIAQFKMETAHVGVH